MSCLHAVLAILALVTCSFAQDKAANFQFGPPDQSLLDQSNQLDNQITTKGLVFQDPAAQALLDRVSARLIPTPAPERVTFQFRYIVDPVPNAFALANGSIYVTTGLAAALQNEGQLAFVLAHEVGHVVARHPYLAYRDLRKKTVAHNVLELAATAGSFVMNPLVSLGSLGGANLVDLLLVSLVYGYSRELEQDADSFGCQRLLASGYSVESALEALTLVDEHLEFEPTQPFWRTHPKLTARIEEVRKHLAPNPPAPQSPVDYLLDTQALLRFNIALDLDSRRPRTALARATRLATGTKLLADRVLVADAVRSLGAKSPDPEPQTAPNEVRKAARKQVLKMTPDEEQRALRETPAGKAALSANQARAEALYREVIAANPDLPEAHRGLGMLYQEENASQKAAAEYRDYLRLSPPNAPDRLRIERRLSAASAPPKTNLEKK